MLTACSRLGFDTVSSKPTANIRNRLLIGQLEGEKRRRRAGLVSQCVGKLHGWTTTVETLRRGWWWSGRWSRGKGEEGRKEGKKVILNTIL